MSSTPNIEGPPPPAQPDKKSEADTDKFKRMMKVDESDETQKRHKRTKQEEEEEEEEVKDEKVPHTAFKELMGQPKKGESPFDIKGGVKADLTPTEEGPSIASQKAKKAQEEKEIKPLEPNAPLAAKKVPTPPVSKEEKEIKSLDKTAPTSPESKEEKAIEPLEPTPPLTPKIVPTHPESKEEIEVETTVSRHIPVEPLEEKEAAAYFPTPTEMVQAPLESIQKKVEVVTSHPIEEETGVEVPLLKKKPKPSEVEKKEVETAIVSAPPPIPAIPIERPPPPSYLTLNSEMFDLFERLIGLMTIEQTKGVSTTTVTLHMQDSVFNGCQIVLQHYSTAPHAFNLELRGNPEAVQIFSAHINELAAAFQGSKLAFTVNIRAPSLIEEPRPLIRRKEKPGEKKSEE